jgi:molecular chaperone DnaK (HSP70)
MTIIGIDLGTSNSAAAVRVAGASRAQPQNRTGAPHAKVVDAQYREHKS